MAARTSAAVGLCLLVGLAGCSGLVADQPTTEPATTTSTPINEPTATRGAVSVQVTGNGTYTLTVVAVADGTDGVRIRYANGSTATYADVQSRGDLPAGALDGASSIEPISEGSSVSFRTSNGSGGTFDWRAEPTAVVYSVADENGRLLGWNYFDCGNGTLLEVRVDVSENGTVSDGRGCATRPVIRAGEWSRTESAAIATISLVVSLGRGVIEARRPRRTDHRHGSPNEGNRTEVVRTFRALPRNKGFRSPNRTQPPVPPLGLRRFEQ